MMRQTAIGFYIKKLELEGVIASPSDGGAESGAGVVVCHSHPMLGGDMDDPVVSAICGASVREGLVALRFNFRGVGNSQGEFSNGDQEHNDVKAALRLMRAWPGVDGGRVAVAGYSAGATIMLDGLRHLRGASALILIAPTLGALRNRRFVTGQAAETGRGRFRGPRRAIDPHPERSGRLPRAGPVPRDPGSRPLNERTPAGDRRGRRRVPPCETSRFKNRA